MIFIHYKEKVNACEILALIILLVGLFMLMNGSLESFPTEEQIEKVRMCGWLFTAIGGIFESNGVFLHQISFGCFSRINNMLKINIFKASSKTVSRVILEPFFIHRNFFVCIKNTGNVLCATMHCPRI